MEPRKILFVGASESGKTRFLERALNRAPFSSSYISSARGFYVYRQQINEKRVECWDASGSLCKAHFRPAYLANTRLCVYVLDIQSSYEEQAALLRLHAELPFSRMLLVTKVDVPNAMISAEAISHLAAELKIAPEKIHYSSAKENVNCQETLKAMLTYAEEPVAEEKIPHEENVRDVQIEVRGDESASLLVRHRNQLKYERVIDSMSDAIQIVRLFQVSVMKVHKKDRLIRALELLSEHLIEMLDTQEVELHYASCLAEDTKALMLCLFESNNALLQKREAIGLYKKETHPHSVRDRRMARILSVIVGAVCGFFFGAALGASRDRPLELNAEAAMLGLTVGLMGGAWFGFFVTRNAYEERDEMIDACLDLADEPDAQPRSP